MFGGWGVIWVCVVHTSFCDKRLEHGAQFWEYHGSDICGRGANEGHVKDSLGASFVAYKRSEEEKGNRGKLCSLWQTKARTSRYVTLVCVYACALASDKP